MSWPIIIIVILVGLVLVALELVALPGGIAGIVGGILSIIAIWQAYATYGTTAGHITLQTSLAITILLVVIFLKSRTWRKASLTEEIDSKVNTISPSQVTIGSRGKALTRLAPSGNGRFGNDTIEVHTISSFVDPGTAIEVIGIEGYKVTVKPINEEQ